MRQKKVIFFQKKMEYYRHFGNIIYYIGTIDGISSCRDLFSKYQQR